MTDRKITYALNKIKSSKESKHPLEALIRSYHLNGDLLKFILSSVSPDYPLKNKKMKEVFHDFLKEIDDNPSLKPIINKRSAKTLKPWLLKMDSFFKSLKLNYPGDVSALQDETEKIFGILKISANKLFVKNTATL